MVLKHRTRFLGLEELEKVCACKTPAALPSVWICLLGPLALGHAAVGMGLVLMLPEPILDHPTLDVMSVWQKVAPFLKL